MRRPTLALAAASLLLLTAVPGVSAQDGPELDVLCVSVSGEPADGAWDEFSLQDALSTGTAELPLVAAGADCEVPPDGAACMTVAGAAPAEGWTQATLSDAITTGRAQIVLLAAPEACRQVIAETLDPEDAPEQLPLQVLETGIVIGDMGSSFVAIVANPNTETWAAQGLPIAVRVLDKAGAEIEATSSFVTLLPGQVSAVVGFLSAPERPRRVELAFEGADFNWLPTELPASVLEVSAVKTRKDPVMGFSTTGKIRNDGEAQVDGVSVYVIHRDKAGDIIGAEFTLIASIPAGETADFEVPNLSGVGRKQVAETEVYYQLGSVL